jgi:translation initiation factor 3 subunit F
LGYLLAQKIVFFSRFLAMFDSTKRSGAAVSFRSSAIPIFTNNNDDFVVDLLSAALTSPTHTSSPVPDLQVLDESLQNVIEMIDRVISYVKSVQSGKIDGNESVGRYLMDAMCETTDGLEKGRLETLFNTHLQVRASIFARHAFVDFLLISQDSLMVSYLADLIRSQVEVSSRLTLVT